MNATAEAVSRGLCNMSSMLRHRTACHYGTGWQAGRLACVLCSVVPLMLCGWCETHLVALVGRCPKSTSTQQRRSDDERASNFGTHAATPSTLRADEQILRPGRGLGWA